MQMKSLYNVLFYFWVFGDCIIRSVASKFSTPVKKKLKIEYISL